MTGEPWKLDDWVQYGERRFEGRQHAVDRTVSERSARELNAARTQILNEVTEMNAAVRRRQRHLEAALQGIDNALKGVE